MKRTIILAALLGTFLTLSAQQTSVFKMVKDINTTGDSIPSDLIKYNSKLYFVADDGQHGKELWVSDGAQTAMVKDIYPGENGSDIGNLRILDGKLIFTATNPSNGNELWSSDGTEQGTQLLKDMYPGESGSYAFEFVEFANALYFRSDDGIHGTELWRTDGTAAGTMMVNDLRPGEFGSNPSNFAVLNNKLYFNALDGFDYDSGEHGFELWSTDGTSAGTALVKDIYPGGGSYPSNLKAFGNKIYFNADDGTNGTELWASDGTNEGTYMVKNINTGGNGSSLAADFIDFKGKLLFSAFSSDSGREMWTTDGTVAGTKILKDVYTGTEGGVIPQFKYLMYKDKLYLTLRDEEHGAEIWVTDGTTEGTKLFVDVFPGPENSMGITQSPMLFHELTGLMYFRAIIDESYYQLWQSDGTVAGTKRIMVDPINPSEDALGYTPYFTTVGDEMYFTAKYNESGYELWSLTNDQSLATAQSQTTKVSVYPNPASEFIMISGNAASSKVEIHDLSGRLVLSNILVNKDQRINISSLNKGAYILTVKTDKNLSTHKLIKK